jgi:hypothetical protein
MPKALQVCHATSPTFGSGEAPVFPDAYTLVAIVVGESLDDAYQDTNHVDCDWWDHTSVTLVGEPTHRSTSVGDVVVMDGVPYRCGSVGWETICSCKPHESCEVCFKKK